MEKMEFRAQSVEQATELGLKELGLKAEDAIIEVIEQGGLFSEAIVMISARVEPEQAAADFLNNLFMHMKVDAYAELTVSENDNLLTITGADAAQLIGYRGDILDSLQYLALLVANKGSDDFVRISIDTEDYRNKRKSILVELAKNMASKAVRMGRAVELEPMNPFERRTIHFALQDNQDVTTQSVGVEPNRFLVIIPKGTEYTPGSGGGYNDRRRSNSGGGYGGGRSASYDSRGGGGYGNRNDSRGGRDGGRGRDGRNSRNNSRNGGGFGRGGSARDTASRNSGYGYKSDRLDRNNRNDATFVDDEIYSLENAKIAPADVEQVQDVVKEQDVVQQENSQPMTEKKPNYLKMKQFGHKKKF